MANAPMFASASFAAISLMPALILASSRASRPAFASSSAVFIAVKAKVISFELADIVKAMQGVACV